jgi:hypothetical protein
MPAYVFSEPTPTISPSGLTHSGRGGAGNVRPSTVPTPSKPVTVVPQSGRFHSGIGGAGNAHGAAERKPMSFHEEFERARARDNAPVSHCGIGGAGNVYRRDSGASDSDSSERRTSETSSFWGRLSISSLTRRE